MATQFYTSGPAEVWVGTGGNLPTRLLFPGGGPNCTGANGVVTAVDATTKGILNASITDAGNYFRRTPMALACGGGWGFVRQGTVSNLKVTGVAPVPGWPAGLTFNGGAGYSYRASTDFAFEFAGWTEGPVSIDVSSPMSAMLGDHTLDMASGHMLQGKEARVGLTFKKYSQIVLERMRSRCAGDGGIDSYGGYLTPSVTTPVPDYGRDVSAGAMVQAQFCYFPLVIRASNSRCPPKRFFYGNVDEDGDPRDGIPDGIHFPVAVVEGHSEPFTWRARKVTMNVVCHWVSDFLTHSGMLYDFAVGCLPAEAKPD